MKEYMELPVNKEGFMHEATKQSALYAIISSSAYAGELNAVISEFRIAMDNHCDSYETEAERFTRQLKNVRLEYDGRHKEMRILSHPYMENKYAYLYQDAVDEASFYRVEAKIEYIQDSDAWSAVKLIFSNGIWGYYEKKGRACFENEYSVQLTSQGRLFFYSPRSGEAVRIFDFHDFKEVFLKMEWRQPKVSVQYSEDGVHWNVLQEERADYLNIEEIGLFIEPKRNSFFADFFTSNMQLIFDTEKKNIMTFPQLNYDNQYFSNMLESYSMPKELGPDSSKELVTLFMQFIEEGRYICVRMGKQYETISLKEDEETLEGISILYGFDLRKKIFKRMTFYGRLRFEEISFESFIKGYEAEKYTKDRVTFYKYKSWRYPNPISVRMIRQNLKAYLKGTGSFSITARKRILYFADKPFLYGVGIFEAIAKRKEYMEVFLLDGNLSKQIYVHYAVMLHMLEFLYYAEIMDKEHYMDCTAGFKELARISGYIENMVNQNPLDTREAMEETLSNLLLKLKDMDEKETKKILLAMNEK